MAKFGLPDIVVSKSSPSESRPTASLVNVLCQALATIPQVEDPANYRLEIASIKPATVEKSYQKELVAEGTGKLVLALIKTDPEEGDEQNSQIGLDFRHSDGGTEDERQASAVATFWGSNDGLVQVKHDAKMLELSKQAREKLIAMAPNFRTGPPEGTRLLVKGPFARDDSKGMEWMWVEVIAWKEGQPIEGLLQNDSFYVKSLRIGSAVNVEPEKAFDYILYREDGTQEGNETGRLMQENEDQKTR